MKLQLSRWIFFSEKVYIEPDWARLSQILHVYFVYYKRQFGSYKLVSENLQDESRRNWKSTRQLIGRIIGNLRMSRPSLRFKSYIQKHKLYLLHSNDLIPIITLFICRYKLARCFKNVHTLFVYNDGLQYNLWKPPKNAFFLVVGPLRRGGGGPLKIFF